MYPQPQTNLQESETNPHFRRPLQPQQRYDQHSQPPPTLPSSQQVQQPRHQGKHSRRHKTPTPSSEVKQPRHHGKHSQPDGPHKSEPLHQEQLQPPYPRVQDQPSQPSGPRVQDQPSQPSGPRVQDQPSQGEHPQQSHQTHGPRIPRDRPTTPLAWFAAVFCAILWVVIIVGGIIVLIVYLVFRPRSPGFDISSATLNAAYLDMGYLLNADVTLLANFTNPNKKVSVDYSYMYINLYYGSTLIATQYIEPFSAAKAEVKFANIHMVTSQVRLPLGESRRLQKQMESNGVMLEVKGVFRARSNLGSILRYSYWLHGQCTILTTAPPDGALIRSQCKTKH